MAERFPGNRLVAIDVPSELADALLAHVETLIDLLRHALANMRATVVAASANGSR